MVFVALHAGTAESHNLVLGKGKAKTLTLKQTIKWQKRVIRHDQWVIRTRKVHHPTAVRFARAQLWWTGKELRQSQAVMRSRLAKALPSGICWSCWDRVAYCESTGNWSINTGNSFHGGLQFTHETWVRSGGGRFASDAEFATREQQIIIASKLSLSNWPVCGARYN
jgi:hypothetical protein